MHPFETRPGALSFRGVDHTAQFSPPPGRPGPFRCAAGTDDVDSPRPWPGGVGFDSLAVPARMPGRRQPDMSDSGTLWPIVRGRVEARCLVRALVPMSENDGRTVAKVVALILVSVWSIITLSLTFESVAAVSPPYYGMYTAIVFLLIGRLWNLEVRNLFAKE